MYCSHHYTGEYKNVRLAFFSLALSVNQSSSKIHTSVLLILARKVGNGVLTGHGSSLALNTLQMLHSRTVFLTRDLSFGIHQFSRVAAILFAVPKCITCLWVCLISFCANTPFSRYVGSYLRIFPTHFRIFVFSSWEIPLLSSDPIITRLHNFLRG